MSDVPLPVQFSRLKASVISLVNIGSCFEIFHWNRMSVGILNKNTSLFKIQ